MVSRIFLSPIFASSILLISLFFMGCSQITLLRTEELRKVQGEVKAVRTQIVDLQKSIDDLNLAQGGTSSKMKADLTLMLKELQTQIIRLQSQIDETQYRLTTLSTKIEKLDQKKFIMSGAPVQNGQALTPGQPGATIPPGSTGASMPPGSTPAPETVRVVEGLDLENLFNQARDDYIRGKYDLALTGFKSVYEKDAGGTWKELAMFWLGETMLKQERPDKALEAYQRVIKEFPRGNKTCSAHFKAGLIHNQKKDSDKRDEEWSKLISECPGSNEAQRAQEIQKE
jgi:TolA-binding protein